MVVAAGLVIITLNYGAWLSYGAFFKPIIRDFGWTRAATAGAYSLSTVMIGVCSILFGWLIDRYSPKIVLIICGISTTSGLVLLSTINSQLELYLYFGIFENSKFVLGV